MQITCPACQNRFVVPDERLPKNQVLTAPCPRCKQPIRIDTRPQPPGEPAAATGPAAAPAAPAPARGAARPQPSGATATGVERAALLGPGEAGRGQVLTVTLRELGYFVDPAATVDEALEKLKFNRYDILTLDDGFGGHALAEHPVLEYVAPLPMAVRRNLFLVLVGPAFKTGDQMAAFALSANLVVGTGDLGNLPKVLTLALQEHERFYRVFRETLAALGRQ